MAPGRPPAPPEAEPGMRGLWLGILAYRWAAFVWMAALAATVWDELNRPALALGALVVAGVWNLWFSVTRGWERGPERSVDLAISVALLPVSGLVMEERGILGSAPFFATSYPAGSALSVGAGGGPGVGLAAGTALAVALAFSRLANGIALTDLSRGEWAALLNGAFYYIAAGGAAGVVRRVLTRSAAERSRAIEEAALHRERAARMAEREALGRRIHDSVLQALALVGKRGKELAQRASVRGEDVRDLVELAGRQEQALRELLSERPEEPAPGMVSLRTVLQAAAFGVDAIPVTVSTAGPVWFPAADVEELAGALRQALDNVVQHAHASRATLFGEEEGGRVVVSVRDDGVGFDYDESRLAGEGKLGMLRSMKGRVEGLGGSMLVRSAVGRGTEVEFRLPVRPPDGRPGGDG